MNQKNIEKACLYEVLTRSLGTVRWQSTKSEYYRSLIFLHNLEQKTTAFELDLHYSYITHYI